MKRRTFILGALGTGGALIVGWSLMAPGSRVGRARMTDQAPWQLNGWVRIYADSRVGVVVPRAEMGQGVHTALPMMLAEELEVPLTQVQIESAPIDPIYGNVALLAGSLAFHPDNRETRVARLSTWMIHKAGRTLGLQVTGGSASVRDAWVPMRQAGAVARSMLLAAAARQWQRPVRDCRMDQGQVVGSDGRRIDIGVLAQAALNEKPPTRIELKSPQSFRLIGKPVARLDVPSKVDGSAQFGLDVRQPGLLFAAVRFCPFLGGAVAHVDSGTLSGLSGIVRVSEFAGGAGAAPGIAVVAHDSWSALSAVERLPVRWHEGPNATLDGVALRETLKRQLDHFDGHVFHERGQGVAALSRAARVVTAEYSVPWLAHATLEPMNCTAQFSADGRLRIWAPTQVASVARHVAARIAGIDANQVELHVTLLGGGFGRRLESDFIAVAVQIARDVAPAPVQVLWSRAQDMTHDMYRPAAVARLKAGLDDQDRPTVLVCQSVSDAISPQYVARAYPIVAADIPDRTSAEGLFDQAYEFTHRSIAHQAVRSPVPIGYWRSVGHSHNAFFIESFVDELAHEVKEDPLTFRLKMLEAHPKHKAVLMLAADKAGWTLKRGSDRALGIALHESFESIVAQVAEVSLEAGNLIVHRVVCAIDCGTVINPQIVAQQMEGSILFGLTAALFGEITIEQGQVMESSFAHYPMALMCHSPIIETYIVASDRAPGGVGEPGVPPIAPAIGNAIYALMGQRLRTLPFRVGGRY